MDNSVLYDFWIASQARNDGNIHRHYRRDDAAESRNINKKLYLN